LGLISGYHYLGAWNRLYVLLGVDPPTPADEQL